MSKHGSTSCVIVKDNNLEHAIKKLSRITNSVLSEHKNATDHYEKPSFRKHQDKKYRMHKIELEKGIK